MRQFIKENVGKRGEIHAEDMAPSLYGSFGKRYYYTGYGDDLLKTNIQTFFYENLPGATKQMGFREKQDSNKIFFCIRQPNNDDAQVQIIDCKGTVEVIVPAGEEYLVVSVEKDKRPQLPEVFEWIH